MRTRKSSSSLSIKPQIANKSKIVSKTRAISASGAATTKETASYRESHNIGRRKSTSAVVTYSLDSRLFFDVYAKFSVESPPWGKEKNVYNGLSGTSSPPSKLKSKQSEGAAIKTITKEENQSIDKSDRDVIKLDQLPLETRQRPLLVSCEARPVHRDEASIPSPRIPTGSPIKPPRFKSSSGNRKSSIPVTSGDNRQSRPISSTIAPRPNNNTNNTADKSETIVPSRSSKNETFQRLLDNRTVFKKHLSVAINGGVSGSSKPLSNRLIRSTSTNPPDENNRRLSQRLNKSPLKIDPIITKSPIIDRKSPKIDTKSISEKNSKKTDKKPITTNNNEKIDKKSTNIIHNKIDNEKFSKNSITLINNKIDNKTNNDKFEKKGNINNNSDKIDKNSTNINKISIKAKEKEEKSVNVTRNSTIENHNSNKKIEEKNVKKPIEKLKKNENIDDNCQTLINNKIDIKSNKKGKPKNEKIESNNDRTEKKLNRKLSEIDSDSSISESKRGKRIASLNAAAIINCVQSADSPVIKRQRRRQCNQSMISDDSATTISNRLSSPTTAPAVASPDETTVKAEYSVSSPPPLAPVPPALPIIDRPTVITPVTNRAAKFFDITTGGSKRSSICKDRESQRQTEPPREAGRKRRRRESTSSDHDSSQKRRKARHKCPATAMTPITGASMDRPGGFGIEDTGEESLWRWEGIGEQRRVQLQLGSQPVEVMCYPAIKHARDEVEIRTFDCVMLRSSADQEPFLAKITAFYLDQDTGKKMMTLLWYYRPEHTEQGRLEWHTEADVYASRHLDNNSVDCIEDKAFVLPVELYSRFMAYQKRQSAGTRPGLAARLISVNSEDPAHTELEEHKPTCVLGDNLADMFVSNWYYTLNFQNSFPPEMTTSNVFVCRGLYDINQHKITRNILHNIQSPKLEPLDPCESVDSAMSISSCESVARNETFQSSVVDTPVSTIPIPPSPPLLVAITTTTTVVTTSAIASASINASVISTGTNTSVAITTSSTTSTTVAESVSNNQLPPISSFQHRLGKPQTPTDTTTVPVTKSCPAPPPPPPPVSKPLPPPLPVSIVANEQVSLICPKQPNGHP